MARPLGRRELLLGLVIDTKRTELTHSDTEPSNIDATIHMAYVAQQRLDGYDEAVQHAIKQKTAFDRRVLKRQRTEVTFTPGQLVQIYRSDLDNTFKTERKLLPKWSQPHRITSRLRNSYRLETLTGTLLSGEFSARRLRTFIPREGTHLYNTQQQYMQNRRGERAREDTSGKENDNEGETTNADQERADGLDDEDMDSEDSTEGTAPEGGLAEGHRVRA